MSKSAAKNKTMRVTALFLALMMVLVGLSGCLATTGTKKIELATPTVAPPVVKKSGTLVVGVDSTRAPYAGLSKGNLVGIDIDVAAALADKLGLKLELVDTAGKNANELLQAGELDMVMDVEQNGIAITQGTEIGPYVISGPALFTKVKGDNIPSIDIKTLTGTKIVAQKDSLSGWAVDQYIAKGTSSPVNNLEDALKAVSDGQATYAAADAVVGSYLSTSYNELACVKLFPQSSIGVYIGVSKSNTQLADALTKALRAVRDNGELKIILTKWLGPVSASVVSSAEAVVSKDSTGTGTTGTSASGTSSSGTVDLGEDLPDPSLAGGTSSSGTSSSANSTGTSGTGTTGTGTATTNP